MSFLSKLNPITPIIAAAGNIYGTFAGAKTRRAEIQDAAHARKTDLIKSADSHNHSWEMASLKGDTIECILIRLGVYLEVAAGVVITIIDPERGLAIWAALDLVPTWITGIHITIAGWGFGSQPLKAVGAGLVGSILQSPKKQE
tara:strand:+ start:131 stop:562 length:432 start_codon:yes stop_codon:yes gene_type:complete